MILWRISKHKGLDGEGGKLAEGRWHSIGQPIVYCSETASLAVLEVLVHLELDRLPRTFDWLKIEAPDDLAHVSWPEPTLRDHRRYQDAARSWGDAWLRSAPTALARVPTVIAPDSYNWLINPRHSDAARVRVVKSGSHPWDIRLFRRN